MPVPRIKSAKRPADSSERNTAIHHRAFVDIRRVIESDEAMPYQLRIHPKRHCRQTEQDEKIGSLEYYNVTNPEGFRTSFVGCGKVDSFSLLRGPFSHAFCETIQIGLTQQTLKLFRKGHRSSSNHFGCSAI